MATQDHTLSFLLDLDGEEINYEGGYTARFRVRKVKVSAERPHGVAYALTFHGPGGKRLMGYDNAHGIPHRGGRFVQRPPAHDHWHRDESDEGRPYDFTDAETLVADFFDEINRVMKEGQS